MNRLMLFALILIGCNPDGPESPSNPNTFTPSVFFKMDGRQYQELNRGTFNGIQIENAGWHKQELHSGEFHTYIDCVVSGPDNYKYTEFLFIVIKDYPLIVGKTYSPIEIQTPSSFLEIQSKSFRISSPKAWIKISKNENGFISGTFHFDTMQSNYVSYPLAYVTDGVFTDIKED